MPSISVSRAHKLSHTKARNAAEKIARDLKQRFQLDYAWDGDDMTFARPGVKGRMHVGKSRVALDVQLGLLLTPIKPAIEREIHAQFDRLFGTSSKA
ncbi:MAG TPA: polyhydroxyalkanoic acid system family protein [Casimicrobiaceae bacterium]|jgi:putative polyhydroxyalkanoate system protein